MRILCYQKPPCTEQDTLILDRAAHKKHLLRKLLLWDILLFAALGILGPLLHNAAQLPIPLLRFFVPVNESVWEHLKLLFVPAFLVAMLRRLCTGHLQRGILTTFAQGLLLSMVLMTVGFYTYSGILGRNSHIANITLFYLCSLFLTLWVHVRSSGQKKSSLSGLLILLLLAGCFVYFTLYPPDLAIFTDFSQSLQ
jgi:quinol-cytochrome oxidoreductase complex cytochrome b subunit